jgi:hypothetical protein
VPTYTFSEFTGSRSFGLTMTVDEYIRLMETADENDSVMVDIEDETVRVVRDFKTDAMSCVNAPPGNWPKASVAMSNPGASPEEIRAERAWLASEGVPTEYTKNNEPILTSQKHRRDYMKKMGYIDRQGGYGDNTDVRRDDSAG